MSLAVILVLAVILDAIFGEPEWLWSRVPHPAIVIGRMIGWIETRFNHATNRKFKGAVLVIFLGVVSFAFGSFIHAIPDGGFLEILCAAILMAQRSLVNHVTDVSNALRISLPQARQDVAKIVGRDTRDMDEPDIARAAIESAAENFSDGFVAPVFWFLILGLPGLLLYKTINTADSMIGHRTERFAKFGWAAARTDDVMNWVPARLTAALIAIAHGRYSIFTVIRRDASLHRSPNAGWPEAAIAICLNIRLSGPRSYDSKKVDFPWVFPEGNPDCGPNDIDRTVAALWRTWVLILAILIFLTLVWPANPA